MRNAQCPASKWGMGCLGRRRVQLSLHPRYPISLPVCTPRFTCLSQPMLYCTALEDVERVVLLSWTLVHVWAAPFSRLPILRHKHKHKHKHPSLKASSLGHFMSKLLSEKLSLSSKLAQRYPSSDFEPVIGRPGIFQPGFLP